jgi:hypothetical protein
VNVTYCRENIELSTNSKPQRARLKRVLEPDCPNLVHPLIRKCLAVFAMIWGSTLILPRSVAQGCPAAATDASFPYDRVGSAQQYPGDFPVFFRVTRVVGPGTAGEFVAGQSDPRNNGFVTPSSWSVYTENGVVSKAAQVTLSAQVSLPASYYYWLQANTLYGSVIAGAMGVAAGSLTFPADGYVYVGATQLSLPVTVNFTLNGVPLKQLSFQLPITSNNGGSQASSTLCQIIPDASVIKFARKLDSSGGTCTSSPRTGETTCPGVNEIDAKYIYNKSLERIGYGVGYNPLNVIGRADNLSFKALAPILMAHGMNANEQWFDDGNYGGSCTPQSVIVGASAFIQPFDQAKVPYALLADVPCQAEPLGGMGQGLIADVGGHMYYLVRLFAGKFGATKVHLVAHSKGGLWSRFAVTKFPAYSWQGAPLVDSYGALSLTTLDTPHHGSVGADLKQAWLQARWIDIGISPQVLLGAFGPEISTSDLTVAKVEAFNSSHRIPPTQFKDTDGRIVSTVYRSISSDADRGDKTAAGVRYVDSSDVFPFFTDSTAAQKGNALYQIMGRQYTAVLQGLLLRTLAQVPTSSFALNDLIVTRDSARYVLPGMGVTCLDFLNQP